MRIGIDARMLNQSGIGRYIRNLLDQLQIQDLRNEYIIFLLKRDFERINLKPNFKKVEANFKWYSFSEQLKFPGLIAKYSIDLMHFPHFNIPIFYKGKFVVTIHDLIHQHFSNIRSSTHGKLIYKVKRLGYNLVFAKALENSLKIITVSNFVKKDLIKEWKINSEKITVTYEAVEQNLIEEASKMSDSSLKKVLKKYKIHEPFIFYIGNAHPHKNVEGLIEGFLSLRQTYPNLILVLSGSDHYFWQRIKRENSHPNIIFTGFIADLEMIALYKKASLRVIPSFEEGFGIPMLESFALKCPVVSSNAASLPEIGGDGAVYFDPYDKQDLVSKIKEVLSNQTLRKRLITKGLKKVGEFSWEKCARETLRIYKTNC